MTSTTLTTGKQEILPPPTERYTVLGWIRKNLFGSWFDGILTIVGLAFIIYAGVGSLRWAFTSARWSVITDNFALFMKGQYPLEQVWRLWVGLYLLAFVVGLLWGVFVRQRSFTAWVLLGAPVLFALIVLIIGGSGGWLSLLLVDVLAVAGWALARWQPQRTRRAAITLLILYFPLLILIIRGFGAEGFLSLVPTNLWGGLLLSLLIAVVGIVFSFPFGVLLALGRQSQLRAVKTLCVIYIEFIRGVPLITLLFMGQVMLPFFLPSNVVIDRVIRAMVAVILFAAAYLAENVRGGLQAIPKGQYEAADAIGLNGFQKMTYIILPQALRAVIPVLVGQFIGLFKDTSLVALVGLLDLLGIARGVLANPNYIGRQIEVYVFVALVYWVFSYSMSYGSRRLEVALGVGER
ncbi:MAG: amino acid ABC transporter permease [Caldilineae bacterium]|nr:MAG: amino acid ABC transporter permease [Caldilineae bacterium]